MNADQVVPNKRIIEEIVAEVGGELGLKLATDWTDAPSKMENYKLKIRCEESGKSTVLEFPSKELWFKTWMQEPGEDIAEFLKNEKELRPESYERKKEWKTRISQAVKQEFGDGGEPIGFNPCLSKKDDLQRGPTRSLREHKEVCRETLSLFAVASHSVHPYGTGSGTC